MIINIGMRRKLGPKGTIFTDADWTYSGGASTSAPATIYSNVNGANSVTIKYNGAVVYLTKTVGGVVTYATVPLTNSAGTYRIKAVVNSDNSMTLYANGVKSQTGYGSELFPTLNFTTGWNKSASITINSADSVSSGASSGYVYKNPVVYTTGKIYRHTHSGSMSSGTLQLRDGNTTGIVLSGNGTVTSACVGGGYVVYLSGAGATLTAYSLSGMEVYNNTDTQKYTFV